MIALDHLQKFVKDRPREFSGKRGKHLAKMLARARQNQQALLLSDEVEKILGKSNFMKLCELIFRQPEYVAICVRREFRRYGIEVIIESPGGIPAYN